MAVSAGRDCLARACLSPTSARPGMILVASGSAERRFPGPAAEVAHGLGFPGIPAVDLPLASAGSLFGIVLGAQLAPQYGPVLVIASEKMSVPAATEPLDKNIAILFGDGAGACLIQPDGPGLQIVDSVLHSDGAWATDLQLGFTGPIHMNGPTVIMQAARKIPVAISELAEAQRGRTRRALSIHHAPGEPESDRPRGSRLECSRHTVLQQHPEIRKYVVGVPAGRRFGMARASGAQHRRPRLSCRFRSGFPLGSRVTYRRLAGLIPYGRSQRHRANPSRCPLRTERHRP